MSTRKIAVSTALYLGIMVACISVNGVPWRMHAVNALALFLAFWLPAQSIGSLHDWMGKTIRSLPTILAGLLTWDLLSAHVLAGRQFMMGAVYFYPLGFLAMPALLFLYALGLRLLWWISLRMEKFLGNASANNSTNNTGNRRPPFHAAAR